jgi:hypothetical protein
VGLLRAREPPDPSRRRLAARLGPAEANDDPAADEDSGKDQQEDRRRHLDRGVVQQATGRLHHGAAASEIRAAPALPSYAT